MVWLVLDYAEVLVLRATHFLHAHAKRVQLIFAGEGTGCRSAKITPTQRRIYNDNYIHVLSSVLHELKNE